MYCPVPPATMGVSPLAAMSAAACWAKGQQAPGPKASDGASGSRRWGGAWERGVGGWMKTFLPGREDPDGYQKVRAKYMGDVRPASTFLIVSGLANPDLLVEVEAVAAKA